MCILRKSKEYKALVELTQAVENYVYALDKIMSSEQSSIERGRKIGSLTASLCIANDQVRYFALGIDYRKDKQLKDRVEARLAKVKK